MFADGGYAGPKLRGALDKIGDWTVEIVKRSDTAVGFEVIKAPVPFGGQPGTGGKLSLCFHAAEPDFEVAEWARSSDRSEIQAIYPEVSEGQVPAMR